MLIVTIACGIAFLLIAFCTYFNHISYCFYLALVASVLIGSASSIAESTVLGYLKIFPADTIGYYESGVGIAGIGGSGVLLVFKLLGLSDT